MDHYAKTIIYQGKRINQYTLEEELVREWKDIREIMDNNAYGYTSLIKALSGAFPKAFGFKWQYVEDKEKIELKEDEVFKKIGMYQGKDYNNFEVSNYGNVRNIVRNNLLKGSLEHGYRIVCLGDNISKKTNWVKCHILVANYFIEKNHLMVPWLIIKIKTV